MQSTPGDPMTRWHGVSDLAGDGGELQGLCEAAFELARAASDAHGGVRPFVVWSDVSGAVCWDIPPATEDGRVLEAAYGIAFGRSVGQLAGVVDRVLLRPAEGSEREAERVVLLSEGAVLGAAYGLVSESGDEEAWFERRTVG